MDVHNTENSERKTKESIWAERFPFLQTRCPNHDIWAFLSYNPNLAWEHVQAFKDAPWDWHSLSMHNNITCDVVKRNWMNPWSWEYLLHNTNMDMTDVDDMRLLNMLLGDDASDWNDGDMVFYYLYGQSKNVTTEFVQQHIHKHWDWSALSFNLNVSLSFIRKHIVREWKWEHLSENPHLTWDIVRALIYQPWDWTALSYHPKLTWEVVTKVFPGKPWNWKSISQHHCISWDIVESTIDDHPWDFMYVSINPNVRWDHVVAHPDRQWNFGRRGLALNPNITVDTILANPERAWEWSDVSKNRSLRWRHVERNPDKPWHWFNLSGNPGISWYDVYLHRDMPWDWCRVCQTKNIFDTGFDIVAMHIQRKWRRAVADPDYLVCRKRLMAEHEDMRLDDS
jgi:hypothetical protein